MGEKVIVASRSIVVTLVICRSGEKRMELVPRAKNLPKSHCTPLPPLSFPRGQRGHPTEILRWLLWCGAQV